MLAQRLGGASRPAAATWTVAAVAALSLAGGCATTCPLGTTMLRDACVDQRIANYAMCIRERAAMLDEQASSEVSGKLDVMKIESASQMRDSMIRHFESNDDGAVVTRIVNQCYAMSVEHAAPGGDTPHGPGGAPAPGPRIPGTPAGPVPPDGSGETLPQPLSVSPPRLSDVDVTVAIHNPGRKDALLTGATLHLACDGVRVEPGVPLHAAGPTPACPAGGVSELRLQAYYRDFPVPLPHRAGCGYTLSLQFTGGDLGAQQLAVGAERQGQHLERRTVTMYEFDEAEGVDDPARRRAFQDYRSAIREATLSAPTSLPEEIGATVGLQLVEVRRGEGGAPRVLGDLHEIQRLTRSLEVISGSVVPGVGGATVNGQVYVGSDGPGPSAQALFELSLSLGDRVDGFEVARQCHELLIYYALYEDARTRREPPHVQIGYLSEADATGAALLGKPRLPPRLLDAVGRWRQRIAERMAALRPPGAEPS